MAEHNFSLIDSQMMRNICSEHGLWIPVTEMEKPATVYTGFLNHHHHDIWLTLEPAEKSINFSSSSELTRVKANRSKDFTFSGLIRQGESARRIEGGPYVYVAQVRLSVFHEIPEEGAVPDYTKTFPVKAKVPAEATDSSGLALSVTVHSLLQD